LKQETANITKYFEPGDAVRVIDGNYKGETGLVTSHVDRYTLVVLDQTNKELKILSNHLKLKSEID
jgi:transcription elongation factor